MVAPVIEATLYSLRRDRVERLGGYDHVDLEDLQPSRWRRATAMPESASSTPSTRRSRTRTRSSTRLQRSPGGVLRYRRRIRRRSCSGRRRTARSRSSSRFRSALTEDSRVLCRQPWTTGEAQRVYPADRSGVPAERGAKQAARSISGLWKADLFLGNPDSEKWVGTTVKSNANGLVGAQGLRIGIYPKVNAKDAPRKDDDLRLIRLPLHTTESSWSCSGSRSSSVGAFFRARGKVPPPISLPDAEDRFVTGELAQRASSGFSTSSR